jgi:hypothetical protein
VGWEDSRSTSLLFEGLESRCRKLEWGVGGVVVAQSDAIEDLLGKDDVDVDAFGEVGKELGDEWADGIGGVADGDASGCGGCVGGEAWNVKVRDLCAERVVDQGGVVQHEGAVVMLGDEGMDEGMLDAVPERLPGDAVVARILMEDDREKEGPGELTLDVFGEAIASEASPSTNAGAVDGVRVGSDGDAGEGGDGEEIVGVDGGAGGEDALLRGCQWTEISGVDDGLELVLLAAALPAVDLGKEDDGQGSGGSRARWKRVQDQDIRCLLLFVG